MFFDFFGRKGRVVDIERNGTRSELNRKNKWLIIFVVIAVGILALGSCDGENNNKQETIVTETTSNNIAYAKEMAENLEKMLSSVKGAGTVKVMMSFETMDEKVLAVNKKNSLETEITEQGSANNSLEEENIIIVGSGGDEKPYILRENLPAPSGILIAATGAENESVRLELYEAAKALYGISGHRIKVVAASEKK
ncbi:MAG: hypothetical protein IJ285_04625 [Clostridia bacterium]|nr:hypothetical protein [Oscillospiraceae bacterium]MBQ7960485.1 hypothetical protein [Clostridia bacterium]